jgi:uncharacterized repeat protein (TIGR04076 family)
MDPDSCYTPPVRITVVDVLGDGKPSCGYAKGDTWLISSDELPAGLCVWALVSMAPFLAVLRFSGSMPWETDKDVASVCCSDPNNPVVFELRRLQDGIAS